MNNSKIRFYTFGAASFAIFLLFLSIVGAIAGGGGTSENPKDTIPQEVNKKASEKKEEPTKEKAKKTQTKRSYRVKSGDSLYEIALKHNVTVEDIKNKNGLKTNNLSIGQELTLP